MSMEFSISGGNLRLTKKIFIKEMLSSGSVLKKLLNYELEDEDKKRSISIDKTREKDIVIISFNSDSKVEVGEDYRNLVYKLKEKYGGSVRGKIVLTAYCYGLIYVSLDLNTPDNRIEIIQD